MSLKTDKVQLEILLKGDKARAELTELEITSRKLKNELKKLPEGTEEFVRKSAELKKVQTRMDELRNKIGLTGMTMRELRQRSKELMFALNNINPNTPQYKELRGELDKVNNRMRELKGGAQVLVSGKWPMASINTWVFLPPFLPVLLA
jgi:tubulin-specific chaperone A